MQSTRRKFLWVCGGVALHQGTVANRSHAGSDLRSVTKSSWALGSNVSVTALHSDSAIAKRAIEAAFEELALVEELMSIYRDDSQVSRLNREGTLRNPHPYVVQVLRTAQSYSQRSGGAFDVTVQPLWSIYASAKQNDCLPSDEAIATARARVDWKRLAVGDDEILLDTGMAITLNGIAQGFAADRARDAILSCGVQHALIDTGEFSTIGRKDSGKQWSIGIQHPRVEEAYVSIAQLDDRCLATSGDYATEFTSDYRMNHLFDPKTGRSPSQLASVSVCAPTAMQADALSTAIFVLGIERGMKLLSTLPAVDALMVLKSGKTFATSQFPVDSQ